MWRCSAVVVLLALATSCVQYPTGGSVRLHVDMVDQPSFRAQENPRPLPEGAVPMPVKQWAAASGQQVMSIYCSPCHGESGKGDGTVAAKMAKPADLTSDKYAAVTDEYLFKAIREGSGLMPSYAEAISAGETHAVVSYIRTLQPAGPHAAVVAKVRGKK